VAETGTVDRDGFQLEWVREGRGFPMIVLGARRFYPGYFPQALRENFEIVFCDLRQWVPTPDGFDTSTITRDTFFEDIEAICQVAGLDRPIVAGQSQHGMIALEYATHVPERVRGVVAVAPNAPAGSGDGLEAPEDFFRRDANADRLAAHERYQAQSPASVETSEDFVEAYLARSAMVWYDYTADTSFLWEGSEVNLDVMDRVFQPEVFGEYHPEALDVPVFLALGRYDYALPFYLWDEPKKKFSNLRYKLYDKSAHQPPYEQPEEFTADLLDWARGL
jgi:proline iminopeptidase